MTFSVKWSIITWSILYRTLTSGQVKCKIEKETDFKKSNFFPQNIQFLAFKGLRLKDDRSQPSQVK